jgi:hypothetical protein
VQEGVGRGRGAIPEGEKKGGWRLVVELTRGGPPVREKKRGRLPFRDGNRWAAEFGSSWAALIRSNSFSSLFFLLFLFFSVFLILLYLLHKDFKFSQTNV